MILWLGLAVLLVAVLWCVYCMLFGWIWRAGYRVGYRTGEGDGWVEGREDLVRFQRSRETGGSS